MISSFGNCGGLSRWIPQAGVDSLSRYLGGAYSRESESLFIELERVVRSSRERLMEERDERMIEKQQQYMRSVLDSSYVVRRDEERPLGRPVLDSLC